MNVAGRNSASNSARTRRYMSSPRTVGRRADDPGQQPVLERVQPRLRLARGSLRAAAPRPVPPGRLPLGCPPRLASGPPAAGGRRRPCRRPVRVGRAARAAGAVAGPVVVAVPFHPAVEDSNGSMMPARRVKRHDLLGSHAGPARLPRSCDLAALASHDQAISSRPRFSVCPAWSMTDMPAGGLGGRSRQRQPGRRRLTAHGCCGAGAPQRPSCSLRIGDVRRCAVRRANVGDPAALITATDAVRCSANHTEDLVWRSRAAAPSAARLGVELPSRRPLKVKSRRARGLRRALQAPRATPTTRLPRDGCPADGCRLASAAVPGARHRGDPRVLDKRVPEVDRDKVRLDVEVDGNVVTIVERRPPWREDFGTEWSATPVARLRYTAKTGPWTSYAMNASQRWQKYGFLGPASRVEALLAELDRDPAGSSGADLPLGAATLAGAPSPSSGALCGPGRAVGLARPSRLVPRMPLFTANWMP